ncbi:hypothetical protein [Nonomuraea dietziae]|uniref:hypothetical protein n=1 Tax=Nonomuraea dietziae TaxID=65515 RepID=UPI0031D95DC1
MPVPDPEGREQRERIILQGDPPSPANPPSGCRFAPGAGRRRRSAPSRRPLLQIRPGTAHASACHFAETHDVVHVN